MTSKWLTALEKAEKRAVEQRVCHSTDPLIITLKDGIRSG